MTAEAPKETNVIQLFTYFLENMRGGRVWDLPIGGYAE